MDLAARQRPVRILHVVGGLNRAGVETWLMHVMRQIDRQRFRFDFLVHGPRSYHYEQEAIQLGSRVIRCLHTHRPWSYVSRLRGILSEYGPYDIVHSHVHHFSGLVLRVAKSAAVPVRIVQSHLDTTVVDSQANPFRKVYLNWMRAWIASSATMGLAVSEEARNCLFPPCSAPSFPVHKLYYSIDLEPFRCTVDRTAVRRELGIPEDAIVIGHVGRFDPQKNHDFLVRIAAEVIRLEPNAWFLLVGDGRLRPTIEAQFRQLGLDRRATFTGVSDSIPRLMLGAMDVFVLPSLCEGLPLVALEAQAAGLPCLFSDHVSKETDVAESMIRRNSLKRPASEWARDLKKLASGRRLLIDLNSADRIEHSPFGQDISRLSLEGLYLATVAETTIMDATGARAGR